MGRQPLHGGASEDVQTHLRAGPHQGRVSCVADAPPFGPVLVGSEVGHLPGLGAEFWEGLLLRCPGSSPGAGLAGRATLLGSVHHVEGHGPGRDRLHRRRATPRGLSGREWGRWGSLENGVVWVNSSGLG